MGKSQNYTEEEALTARTMYEEGGNDILDEIAKTLGKSINSVRAKLVREKVYTAPDKPTKSRKNGPSKKEIIREFQGFGITDGTLNGLQGATKAALTEVKDYIVALKNGN